MHNFLAFQYITFLSVLDLLHYTYMDMDAAAVCECVMSTKKGCKFISSFAYFKELSAKYIFFAIFAAVVVVFPIFMRLLWTRRKNPFCLRLMKLYELWLCAASEL